MTLDKTIAVLNALAAMGASLQATGVLASMSPETGAIVLAVIAALNAVSHALAPAPVK